MLSVTPNEFLTFEYNDIPFISSITIITSERSGQSSYYQSYMGHLDDIQTALKPLKKSEKIEINLYDRLRLDKSFKTMNHPTRPNGNAL